MASFVSFVVFLESHEKGLVIFRIGGGFGGMAILEFAGGAPQGTEGRELERFWSRDAETFTVFCGDLGGW
jgi:hypothetical protein